MFTRPRASHRSPAGPCLGLLLCLTLLTGAAAGTGPWLSEQGHFRISYASRLEPIAINRIHNWVLHLENAAGEPVDGASIRIGGGMPAHNHGLPTSPQVTESLGGGDYLVEGMRFHMMGYWELELDIEAGELADRVTIALEL